jgi:hypothetical protein
LVSFQNETCFCWHLKGHFKASADHINRDSSLRGQEVITKAIYTRNNPYARIKRPRNRKDGD